MICTTLIWCFVMTAFNNCFIIWLSSLFTIVIFRYLLIQLSISWVAYSLQGKGSKKLLNMSLLLFVSSNWQVMLHTIWPNGQCAGLHDQEVQQGLSFQKGWGWERVLHCNKQRVLTSFHPLNIAYLLEKKGGSKPAAARVPTATW